MNRRTLLGRFVFGAAAVLGASVVAPKAEAAEIPNPHQAETDAALARAASGLATRDDIWGASHGLYKPNLPSPGEFTPMFGALYALNLDQAKADAYNRGIAIAEARAESRLAEGLPITRGELTDNVARATDSAWLTRWGQMLAECPNAWPTNGEPPKALCAPGWCAPCDVWR